MMYLLKKKQILMLKEIEITIEEIFIQYLVIFRGWYRKCIGTKLCLVILSNFIEINIYDDEDTVYTFNIKHLL